MVVYSVWVCGSVGVQRGGGDEGRGRLPPPHSAYLSEGKKPKNKFHCGVYFL